MRERLPWTAELSDEAATRDAFRDALSRYNLIHLSAHGYAVGDQPRRSGFLLAHGDHVTVTDLRAWNTEGLELLVLSSCDSAATGGMVPDQMISLPGAVFASSGYKVVGFLLGS